MLDYWLPVKAENWVRVPAQELLADSTDKANKLLQREYGVTQDGHRGDRCEKHSSFDRPYKSRNGSLSHWEPLVIACCR